MNIVDLDKPAPAAVAAVIGIFFHIDNPVDLQDRAALSMTKTRSSTVHWVGRVSKCEVAAQHQGGQHREPGADRGRWSYIFGCDSTAESNHIELSVMQGREIQKAPKQLIT